MSDQTVDEASLDDVIVDDAPLDQSSLDGLDGQDSPDGPDAAPTSPSVVRTRNTQSPSGSWSCSAGSAGRGKPWSGCHASALLASMCWPDMVKLCGRR